MSKLESRGPGRAPMPAAKVAAFFHPLGRTGSVTVAANRVQLRRSSLYQRRQDDEEFAARWARALDLGVERLQESAIHRAMNGTEKAVWRNSRKVGTVQQFDNRLLQFLLTAHRPDLYGDRGHAAVQFTLGGRAMPRSQADGPTLNPAEGSPTPEDLKRSRSLNAGSWAARRHRRP